MFVQEVEYTYNVVCSRYNSGSLIYLFFYIKMFDNNCALCAKLYYTFYISSTIQ